MRVGATCSTPSLPLFVPGNRPQLFAKAASCGADAIIIDLEDAVAAAEKDDARQNAADHGVTGFHVCLRVNAPDTVWFEDDLKMAAGGGFQSVLLPKCESLDPVAHVRSAVGSDMAIIALIESARGVAALPALLEHGPAIDRLAFGSIDFAMDIGCDHEWDAMLFARSQLVLHSRAGGLAAPLDGVTQSVLDAEMVLADAQRASRLGFGGKLLIHPAQVEAARKAFLPEEEMVNWARRVMAVSADGNAVQLDGVMIDRPVIQRAQQILARSHG